MVAGLQAEGAAGPSLEQTAAMLGNSVGTLSRYYLPNTRAGQAQAGVAAMARVVAAQQGQGHEVAEEPPQKKARLMSACSVM